LGRRGRRSQRGSREVLSYTPFEEYDFYGLLAATKWQARGKLIELGVMKEEGSEQKSCIISYEPIPKLSGSGQVKSVVGLSYDRIDSLSRMARGLRS
jgi:hypothetical protein